MAKDPAVLFYSGDFLTGCADLTMEERGQYITLLCLQHQKGRLSEKTIRLSVGSVSVDVMAKFLKDEKGLFFNERMENEAEKRANFTESRRINGLQGGRPIKEKPYGKPKKNHMDKHMGNHMGNENENKDVIDIESRKKIFAEKVNLFGQTLPKETLISFYEYWTEHNEGGKKMRFEMEKVFDYTKRLATWTRNNKKFNNGKPKSGYNTPEELAAAAAKMDWNS